jgi:hypothetical protein
VIVHFEAGELESVGGRDDDDALLGPHFFLLYQLEQRRQRDARLRTTQ